MKRLVLIAGVSLLLASLPRAASAQFVDAAQYRAWVQRKDAEAAIRVADPMNRQYYGYGRNLPFPRGGTPPPSHHVTTQSYYKGPGGEILARSQLPKDANMQGYRFIGNYGPAHRRP